VNYDHSLGVRFSLSDLTLFSAASHDRNPCHLSSEYARTTFYGGQVVFGILGALACLSAIRTPDNYTLSKSNLEFRHPMFLDIDYDVSSFEPSPGTICATLSDGSRTLVKMECEFAEVGGSEIPWGKPHALVRQIPNDPEDEIFAEKPLATGEFVPDATALKELLERFGIDERRFGRFQLSALLWSSYLVGMEQPGLRSLFHKLTLAFENLHECCAARFFYEAKVVSINAFGSLRSELHLFSGDKLVARGESRAYVIPRRRLGSVKDVAALVSGSGQLRGKVALVVGASRGLGAMLTTALALQGSTVLASFNRSQSEAQRLRESLAGAPGRVVLVQGDAANLTWCGNLGSRISQEFGRLDFLICNACPPLLPFLLEPRMVGRINTYIADALALVSTPLSVFSSMLTEKSGWCVAVSSAAVETAPKEWPHYVASKYAIEGLVRVAALQFPEANFLLVRPPRLRTDLTNRPANVLFGKDNVLLPEVVAAKVIERLQSAPAGQLEVLSVFTSASQEVG
jgi:NAD(P)-dependent dehydrogenase (short-subunit alcohol dehydrogenase family)